MDIIIIRNDTVIYHKYPVTSVIGKCISNEDGTLYAVEIEDAAICRTVSIKSRRETLFASTCTASIVGWYAADCLLINMEGGVYSLRVAQCRVEKKLLFVGRAHNFLKLNTGNIMMVVGGDDGKLTLVSYALSTNQLQRHFVFENTQHVCSISPDGNYIVAVSDKQDIAVYRRNGERCDELQWKYDAPSDCDSSLRYTVANVWWARDARHGIIFVNTLENYMQADCILMDVEAQRQRQIADDAVAGQQNPWLDDRRFCIARRIHRYHTGIVSVHVGNVGQRRLEQIVPACDSYAITDGNIEYTYRGPALLPWWTFRKSYALATGHHALKEIRRNACGRYWLSHDRVLVFQNSDEGSGIEVLLYCKRKVVARCFVGTSDVHDMYTAEGRTVILLGKRPRESTAERVRKMNNCIRNFKADDAIKQHIQSLIDTYAEEPR